MDSKTIAEGRVASIANHITSNSNLQPNPCSSTSEGPLDHERKRATFDPRELTYILDGGQQITEIREVVGQVIQGDEVLYSPNQSTYDMTRPEIRERTMARVC